MKRQSCFATARRTTALAGSTLALLALALPVAAQAPQSEPPKDLVPFKGMHTSPGEDWTSRVPLDPPVVVRVGKGIKGESEVFGPYTADVHFTTYLGVDGMPLFSIGEEVWTGANGDSLTFSPLVVVSLPSTKPGVLPYYGTSIIRSGRGRFLGATGHAVGRGEIDLNTGKVTNVREGLVTRPKP
jgi:hypothetical protein